AATTTTANVTVTGTATGTGGAGVSLTHNGAGATSVTVNTATGGADGVSVTSGGGGVTVSTSGTITGGTGTGIAVQSRSGEAVNFSLGAGSVIGATSGAAISDTDGNTTLVVPGTAAVNGSIRLGSGSDTLSLVSTTYSPGNVLDGGDDASVADGHVDALRLDGLSLALTGANITNWESITLANGSLTVSDSALTAGDTSAGTGLFLETATLDAGTGFALTGNLTIDTASTLNATGGGGTYTVSGSIANAGRILLQDGTVGDRVVTGEDYTGTGTVTIDVDFATNTSDQIIVGDDVTGGTTTIVATDVSSGSATGAPITVVDVAGSSVSTGFALSGGSILSGAYRYTLGQESADWVLRSTLRSQFAQYAAIPALMSEFATLDTWRRRTGGRQYLFGNGDHTGQADLWLRVLNRRVDITPNTSVAGSSFETRFSGLQLGADVPVAEWASGTLVLGLSATVFDASATVRSSVGSGRITSEGNAVTATLSYLSQAGFYLDAQAQIAQHDLTVAGNRINGSSTSASLEVGQKLALSNNWIFTPQAQISMTDTSFDSFTGIHGGSIVLSDGNSQRLRLGFDLEKTFEMGPGSSSSLYGLVNFYRDLDGRVSVTGAGQSFVTNTDGWYGEVGLGGEISWNNGDARLFGEVTGLFDIGSQTSRTGLSAVGGVRLYF
ncbi:MAG: autotransporter outer membrane beta-barrel domain-containing protein, partial [Paracoccaceae bacterium]